MREFDIHLRREKGLFEKYHVCVFSGVQTGSIGWRITVNSSYLFGRFRTNARPSWRVLFLGECSGRT
jgi:hypothetical protein